MTKQHNVTNAEVQQRARRIASYLQELYRHAARVRIYGVPRGGIPAAYAVAHYIPHALIVDNPEEADVIIDDIIDSGETRQRYTSQYPASFFALYDKTTEPELPWLVFPWEGPGDATASVEDNIVRLLQFIGEDPSREGLRDTPARVAKAWRFWAGGYATEPGDLLKCFADGGEGYDEMILERRLPFYSHCEHHLAPFFGWADIAYIPDGRVVGLSKLPRVLDVFARRLQVQERLTTQVADALMEHLKPKGVAVRITARHLCMESRGVGKQGHDTTTQALRGVFTKPEVRAEFLATLR